MITTGPYAYVCHPGYIFGIILTFSGGAWFTLGPPAMLVVIVLAIRTDLWDATLQRELPGYAEFAVWYVTNGFPGNW